MTKVMTWEWFLALTWNKVNCHSEVVIFTQIIHYIMYVYNNNKKKNDNNNKNKNKNNNTNIPIILLYCPN